LPISSTFKLFNEKDHGLEVGILTADDGGNTKDLPAYNGALMDDGEDVGLIFPGDISEIGVGDEDGKGDDSDNNDV